MTFHIIAGDLDDDVTFHYEPDLCFTCGTNIAAEVLALKPAAAYDDDGDNQLWLGPVCPSCVTKAGPALDAVMTKHADQIENRPGHGGHAAYLRDVVAASSSWSADPDGN